MDGPSNGQREEKDEKKPEEKKEEAAKSEGRKSLQMHDDESIVHITTGFTRVVKIFSYNYVLTTRPSQIKSLSGGFIVHSPTRKKLL